ncbi:MAG: hypothetical protein GF418_13270 [Chitinivibrionales bacterium]|nr:hypothetical protein [Chitinivibrionales bacterium]MBD3396589.1 hypothetical protein [Chitinivibrionales bacterium]
MNYNIDHERFVNKQKGIARAYEVDRNDSGLERKGFSRAQRQQEASCFNCKLKAKCSDFRSKQSGGSRGAVSYGGSEKFICDRYTPAPAESKGMSNKQIKSLLKNVRRGYS